MFLEFILFFLSNNPINYTWHEVCLIQKEILAMVAWYVPS